MTDATIAGLTSAQGADAAAAAELIYRTDPGVWDYLFRGDRAAFDRFATGLWERPDNNFSHSESVMVRDDDGSAIALEMGYRGGAVEFELRRAMRAAATELLPEADLAALLEQARDIDYLAPYIPDDAYYLHFLSVLPEARGRGLGGELLHRAFERAADLGCDSVHLDVYTTNPAVALYRAHGFRIAVESRFPHKDGLPPHYRMVRPL